jgi:hypothetical protein
VAGGHLARLDLTGEACQDHTVWAEAIFMEATWKAGCAADGADLGITLCGEYISDMDIHHAVW